MATRAVDNCWEEADRDTKDPSLQPRISRSPSRRFSKASTNIPEPMLGCQIAPDYQREQVYRSDSDSTDTESETNSPTYEDGDHVFPIEKAETHHSRGVTPALSKVNTQRSRASRKEAAHTPVGFWHWKMAEYPICEVANANQRTDLYLAIAIMVIFCMFWGAVFRQNENVKNLEIIVVDFDGQTASYAETGPFVGPFIIGAINEMTAAGGVVPTFTLRQPKDFGYEPLNVREAVYNMNAWAAVVINPNATALLDYAIRQGNNTYDPAGACHLVYNSARDQTTTSSYVVPSLTALQKRVGATFGQSWILHLQADFQNLHILSSPQAISPGIDFTTYDLRPFGPPIAAPAVSIGLIYLIIISFFSFTFFLPIHMKYLSPKGHPPLLFRHLIAWRYFATVASYFLLSLVYSLVSLAFLMPVANQPASHVWPAQNANAYGRGTFVVYWMGNFVGMTAFGLASENMAMLLGTPWTALWLIFWVISNVSTGFYSLELAPTFYRWGYAWPMHNLVELSRSTLLDLTQLHVGRNFGVLLAWVAVDTVLFPLCCYYMRWNSARVKQNAAQAEAAWQARMEKERDEPSLMARVTTRGSRMEGARTKEGEV